MNLYILIILMNLRKLKAFISIMQQNANKF